jgi:serine/threonine protein kinase/Tol biopolymer transport system component
MDLAAGARLGPYEIVAALGAGGMGEVYRARDTRLDRSVAIKILPSHLSSSPELKSRFEREARTISSVTHPHICHLYDVGSQSGVDYLVMELLEGETLAQRLQKGCLPPHEVLKIGIEIADALANAHRLGLIHRDLKPGNIMLTKNGAKLMDFGLAKPTAVGVATGSASPGFSAAATVTMQSPGTPLTSVGTVVGTIHYMSPEQIEGKEADARSDIFALGAVLYEMATGQRAFAGKSQLSIASAILEKEPVPITTIQAALPSSLDYIIRTCLAKDPEERFQTAHDVKLQLSWLLQSGASAPAAKLPPRRQIAWRAALAAILALLLVLVFLKLKSSVPAADIRSVTRFSIVLPAKQELAVDITQALALSPDGKHLAYVAAESGVSHLYLRRLDEFDSVEVPDSEGATFPFFSADSDWIAFFSQGKLKKAPAGGGDPVVITELPTFFGATWTPQDVIVAAVPGFGLASIPASGGTPQKIAFASQEPISPVRPTLLAGGDWIAFTDYGAARRRVMRVRLSTGELRPLINNAQDARIAAGGQLVYYSAGALWAVPFTMSKLAILGAPVQVASGVNEENYVGQASASQTGVLAYAPGPAGNFSRNLFLVDRRGLERKVDLPADDYVDPAISPDGKRLAVAVRRVGEQQLAVFDRDRGVLMRIISNGGVNAAPVWTPDGKDLLFDSSGVSQQPRGIYRVAGDGSSAAQLLRETSLNSHVTAIAGDYAVVMVSNPVTSTDLWLLSLGGQFEIRPFRRTPAMERQGAFSPDGRWLAYTSNESGRSEIYVEPVLGPGGRWQISTNGGEQPRWARSGREIFYRDGTKMITVAVQTQPAFRAAKPVELFDAKFDRGGAIGGYDVSPDGQTFVMTRSEHASPKEIRVVVGWPEGKQ